MGGTTLHTPQIVIPGWTLGGVRAYDFEFLHAFLNNKKNKIEPKIGGIPPSPPKLSFLGGHKSCEPFWGYRIRLECVRYGKARTPFGDCDIKQNIKESKFNAGIK